MSKWLMKAEELACCYQQSDVVVIDCRFSLFDVNAGEHDYSKGHIPGAYYLHLERDLSGEKGTHGGRHPLPELKRLVQRLELCGIGDETLVVAYDDQRFAFAARLWWLLRYLGHNRVRLLDGGLTAWRREGLPMDILQPEPATQASLSAVENGFMLVDYPEVKAITQDHHAVLIDSREEERYLGLKEPIDPLAGHIPGSVNYPWQGVTDEKGMIKAGHQHRWEKVSEASEIVAYCGSGVTACVNLLSLAEAGREDAKLYAGSWSDWCSYHLE